MWGQMFSLFKYRDQGPMAPAHSMKQKDVVDMDLDYEDLAECARPAIGSLVPCMDLDAANHLLPGVPVVVI